jgi:hypothetical protein
VKLVKLQDKIYAVECSSSKEAAKLFLRFQENYESPKFRNKTFSLGEFAEYYKEFTGEKKFTYYSDWSGFNVPSYIVKRFSDGKFKHIYPQERWLLKEIAKLEIKGKFYLLGYAKGASGVKKHEVAHGKFYTRPEYKSKVKSLLKPFNMKKDPVAKYLRGVGYHNAVVEDEFHAWVLTEKSRLSKAGLWNSQLEKLRKKLEIAFKSHESN